MTFRGLACVVAGGLAMAVPSGAFGVTLVGQYDQSGDQGANSTQSGVQTDGGPGYSAPGTKFVDGNSKGSESQNSTNAEVGVEDLGDPTTAGGTVIGNTSQANKQGIDSLQAAKKGHQNSTNVEVSTEVIAPNGGDAIIGTTTQAASQATNSSQLLAGAPTPGGILFTEATGGSSTQNSLNAEITAQVILG